MMAGQPQPKRPKSKRNDRAELKAGQDAARDRSGGRCEFALVLRCEEWAAVVHHRAGRGFAGCHDPALLLHLCDFHHRFIHANPAEAYLAGWMLKRTAIKPSKAA